MSEHTLSWIHPNKNFTTKEHLLLGASISFAILFLFEQSAVRGGELLVLYCCTKRHDSPLFLPCVFLFFCTACIAYFAFILITEITLYSHCWFYFFINPFKVGRFVGECTKLVCTRTQWKEIGVRELEQTKDYASSTLSWNVFFFTHSSFIMTSSWCVVCTRTSSTITLKFLFLSSSPFTVQTITGFTQFVPYQYNAKKCVSVTVVCKPTKKSEA